MELIDRILRQFAIPDRDYHVVPFHQGLINDTYFVGSRQQVLYVLQRVNDQVFQHMEALVHNLTRVLPYLEGSGYRKLSFVPCLKGGIFYQSAEAGTWRMMEYVSNSKVFNVSDDPQVAREAGRILGRFHALVPAPETLELEEVIADFHKLDFRVAQYESALSEARERRRAKAQESIRFIGRALPELMSAPLDGLPRRICHNDTKLNNVLFSNAIEGLCLIDLDTVMPGFFFYDFGDLARTVVNPVSENEKELSRIDFSMSMFEALVEGLFSAGTFLNDDEVRSLSWGVSYMPFMHGMRALTDYLSGDRYYKVSYPEENLDRARSLLHFSKLALDQRQRMDAVLRSCI